MKTVYNLAPAILSAFAFLPMSYGQSVTNFNEGLSIVPEASAGQYTVSWRSKAGRSYFLQTSETLMPGSWSYVPIIVAGTDSLVEWGFTSNSPWFFQRLRFTDVPYTGSLEGADFDNDGLSNSNEFSQSTDPLNPDSDADELPDGWEVFYGLDPLSDFIENGANGDPDDDSFPNIVEYMAGSNPIYNQSTPDNINPGGGSSQSNSPLPTANINITREVRWHEEGNYQSDGIGGTQTLSGDSTLSYEDFSTDDSHDSPGWIQHFPATQGNPASSNGLSSRYLINAQGTDGNLAPSSRKYLVRKSITDGGQTPIYEYGAITVNFESPSSPATYVFELQGTLAQEIFVTGNYLYVKPQPTANKTVFIKIGDFNLSVKKLGSPEYGQRVTLKAGESVQFTASSATFGTLPDNEISWSVRLLESDGEYTEWGAAGTGANHNQPVFYRGIYQVKALIRGLDFPYIWKQSDIHSSKKRGDLCAFGVYTSDWQQDVLNAAVAKLGDTSYTTSSHLAHDPLCLFDSRNKCNAFIADVLEATNYDIDPPTGGIYNASPPSANHWAGMVPNYGIYKWYIANGDWPCPGYVSARGHFSGSSGHCGIVDFDGQWISAGPISVNRKADFKVYKSTVGPSGAEVPATLRVYLD